jgi:hypothetical protein
MMGEAQMDRQEPTKEVPEYLKEALAKLDDRISRIERHLNLHSTSDVEKSIPTMSNTSREKETLELRIGLYWFAKVGIAALIIGVVFLLLQPYRNTGSLFASAIGYVVAIALFISFRYLRSSSQFLAGYLLGSALVLSFIATLRLHFMTSNPALTETSVELGLLLLVCTVSLVISIHKKSVHLTALSLTMAYISAFLSSGTTCFFVIGIFISSLLVYFVIKYKWYGLLVYGIACTYLIYLGWFLKTFLVLTQAVVQNSPPLILLPVLLYIIIFGVANYLQGKDSKEDNVTIILSSLFNCVGGYFLFLLVVITKFQNWLLPLNLSASFVFITFAVLYWMQQGSKFRTFFYAMIGYAALSVAIVNRFENPELFMWLCWQSLLVVSTAVWFKSKFIVLTNFIIYSIIFITYLLVAETASSTSISFGVVALLSARLLNWQKHRLELKTEAMRNAYLIAAFFIIPYGLYNAVPTEYISLSWLCLAIIYYIVSMILKNTKYRWMSLLTFLATAIYLLIVGVTKLGPVSRIISFIVLGVVLLIISFAYARNKAKSGNTRN